MYISTAVSSFNTFVGLPANSVFHTVSPAHKFYVLSVLDAEIWHCNLTDVMSGYPKNPNALLLRSARLRTICHKQAAVEQGNTQITTLCSRRSFNMRRGAFTASYTKSTNM